MTMSASEYTVWVQSRANDLKRDLEELARKMRENGDEVRAMDIDEAITYVEGASECLA